MTSLSLIEKHCDRGRAFYKMHNQTQEAIRKYTLSHHADIPVIPQEKLLSRLTTTVDNLLPGKIEEEHSKQQEMTPTYLNAIKLLEHFSNHNMDQNALASLYQKLGDYYEIMYDFDKQKSCYTKKLEILGNIHKGDHQNIANTLDNVSIVCYRLEQWKDALFYQEAALEMRQKLYPGSHRDIVASLTNIGNTYGGLGEYEKALAYQEEALQHAKKLCPEENTSDIARCFLSISYMHHALGKKEMNLAKTNKKLDKMDEALQHKKEAIQKFDTSLKYSNKSTEIFKTIHKNTDHINVAKGLNNVGGLREELGKIAQEWESQDEATEHFKAALDVQKQSLDMLKRLCADTPSVDVKIETVLLIYNVGVDYQKIGKAKEGLQYEGEALKLSKEMYKNSFYVADSLKHIGKNYQKFGDHNTALEYYLKAYSMYQSLKEGDDELTTSKKYVDTLAKIRELNPNFVGSSLDQECKNREQIIKTGFKDVHVLTVQEKIQATILNDIYLKAKEQEWKTDLDVDLIQEQLGDLAKDQNNIEIAKMLCFEAMSLGVMHSQEKDLSPIVYFNRSNSTLIEQMLHEHPEYCVDGLILRECTRDQELLAQLLGNDMSDQAINQ